VRIDQPPAPEHRSASLGAPARSRQRSSTGSLNPAKWPSSRRLSRAVRKSSIYEVYEKAKIKGNEIRRERWVELLFEYTFYLVLVCFIYLFLVGLPLWPGAVGWLWYAVKTKFHSVAGFVLVIGLSTL
jgi:hypothetical protein